MRDILFRGKAKPSNDKELNNIWAYGDLIHSGGKLYIKPACNLVNVEGDIGKLIIMHEVIPETIGQFTGLTDENGTRIFEGDILQQVNCNEKGYLYYDKDDGMVAIKFDGYCTNFGLEYNTYFEVIGNIYDNPEMLEVE